MDGCLEVDKGTQHQVGCGRLWFSDLPLKGLTSDATPHPYLQPSLPLSHFLSTLHSKWTNSVFPQEPLRDHGPHIYPSREKRKEARNAQNMPDVQDTEPWEAQCEDERTGRSSERRWLASDSRKQQAWIKRRCPELKGWSLLQSNHGQWLNEV